MIIFIIMIHKKVISGCSVSSSHLTPSLQSIRLSAASPFSLRFYFRLWRVTPRRVLLSCGTRGTAVRGWTREGFYKNNSLTDNLLASSLQRPRVPFGEGAFLFQLHRGSAESQGWSLWVLIAFFPLFCRVPIQTKARREWKLYKH